MSFEISNEELNKRVKAAIERIKTSASLVSLPEHGLFVDLNCDFLSYDDKTNCYSFNFSRDFDKILMAKNSVNFSINFFIRSQGEYRFRKHDQNSIIAVIINPIFIFTDKQYFSEGGAELVTFFNILAYSDEASIPVDLLTEKEIFKTDEGLYYIEEDGSKTKGVK